MTNQALTTCSDCGSHDHAAHSPREWSEIIALSGVTRADLRVLRDEALLAGDQIQADLCDVALSGEGRPIPYACAYSICIDAIRAAEAQADEAE